MYQIQWPNRMTIVGMLPSSRLASRCLMILVALTGALVIGQTSMASNVAPREARGSSHIRLLLGIKVEQTASNSETRVARPEQQSRPRSLKRTGLRSKTGLWRKFDCDDETSRDSDDDDDTTTDLNDNDDDDNDALMLIRHPVLVLYLIGLESNATLSWTASLPARFPSYRQLRC